MRTFPEWGKNAVHENDKMIMKYAEKYNLDPDIPRAVIYAENARGHYLGLNNQLDKARVSTSVLPMNIQHKTWSPLIDGTSEDMYDAEKNIEASTVLLRRITDRVQKPDADKIGTLWNELGAKKNK